MNDKPTEPRDDIMKYFKYAHLPGDLQAVSRPFCELAEALVAPADERGMKTLPALPRNPERTVALRKLLEAKDAAVRSILPDPPPAA